MFVNPCTMEVIRHVPHRWLVRQWARMGPCEDPAMVAFAFEAASIDMSRSIVSRVEGDPRSRRLRILHYGSSLSAATEAEAQGLFLDEIFSERRRPFAMAHYDLCLRSMMPVYSIASTADSNGVPVDYEKLLLPFRGWDGQVNCILTSTLLISTEGRFVRDGIFAHGDFPQPTAAVLYSVQIAQDPAAWVDETSVSCNARSTSDPASVFD